MRLRASVVIPTHNRWEQLRQVLVGYARQEVDPATFEVLVCDDASGDVTPDEMPAFARTTPYTLRYYRQEHKGPAAARNLGITAAQGPVVVLTDDDCVPQPTLLARHLAATGPGVATIGFIAWHPDLVVTPFMDFLSPGYRFNFAQITDPQDATYRCFYTANVSVWRDDLLAVGAFDEGFPAAAYEDIDLGYRLHRQGVRLTYDAAAIVDHLHAVTLTGMLRSQLVEGASAAYLLAKEPALAIEAGVARLREPGVGIRFYEAALDYAFTEAMRAADDEPLSDTWPAALERGLRQTGPVTPTEARFHAANEAARALEEALAQQQAAYRALAARAARLDTALQRANPLKNWLRRQARRVFARQ